MARHLTVLLTATIIFLACTENSPEINQVFWQINKFNDTGNNSYHERLVLFLDVSDEDGTEDLKTLYVINDDAELYWKISSDEWIHRPEKGENWIGTNTITMNDYSPIPAGSYRVVVVDDAGEREETEIFVAATETAVLPEHFPSAVVRQNSLSYSENTEYIWFYSSDMKLISEAATAGNEWKSVSAPEKTKTAYLYRFDRAGGFGLVSGPYEINREY